MASFRRRPESSALIMDASLRWHAACKNKQMIALSGKMLTEFELKAYNFRELGTHLQVSERASIRFPEHITLGDHVRIDDYAVLVASGKGLVLGSHIHISVAATISGRGGFTMGDYSTLSAGVRVFTSNDDYSGNTMTNPTVPERYTGVTHAPVKIGKHVVVGANSVILPGVEIGEGVAIGANSLVKESLEPWTIYAGTPARPISSRSQDLLELAEKLEKSE